MPLARLAVVSREGEDALCDMTMIPRPLSCFAIVLSFVSAGCRAPSPGPLLPLTPIPFEASSLESQYAVRGFFAGTVARERGRLVVTLHDARLRSGAPVRNVRLRAGLGRRLGESWEFDPQGPQLRVRDSLARGEEVQLDSLRRTIPLGDEIILEPHWLAFEIAARHEREELTIYVCSAKDLFRPERVSEPTPSGEASGSRC